MREQLLPLFEDFVEAMRASPEPPDLEVPDEDLEEPDPDPDDDWEEPDP